MNKKPVYHDTDKYAATTTYLKGRANRLLLPVTLITPNVYKQKKEITVMALIDTGATGSAISTSIATEMGLIQNSVGMSFGVHGSEEVKVYSIVLKLTDYLPTIPLMVSEAKLNHEDEPKMIFSGTKIGFLLGMDVIGKGDFFTGLYRGSNSDLCTMFSFHIPSGECPIDFKDWMKEHVKELEDKSKREQHSFTRQQSRTKKLPKSKRKK